MGVILTLNCIRTEYIRYSGNALFLTNPNGIDPANKSHEKYKWNLSSSMPHHAGVASAEKEEMTRLPNILLSGIIHSSDKLTSRAIVLEGGEQNVYSINDVLKSSSKIRITNITKNQVFLSLDGHTQQLTLLSDLTLSSASAEHGTANEALSNIVLSSYIEASPVNDKNGLRGLRLLPRENAASFFRASLEPGDIAIQLNNISLTQRENIAKAQQALNHLQRAQFTVVRKASPQIINVTVQQFQEGKEN